MRTALPLLLIGVLALVVAGTDLLRTRRAAWERPAGPTAGRVLAHIHRDGAVTLTHGPSADRQVSLLPAPVRLHGTRTGPNAEDLERLFDALKAFARPRLEGARGGSLDLTLEIAVHEEATTASLSWLLFMAQWGEVRLTHVELRRMPSGRLLPLDLMEYGEWEGPRPSDKEEPRTYVKLRRGKLPPEDDQQTIKVSRFSHYVGDEHEIKDDGESIGPPPDRYVADLPSISAWRTTAARRLLADRLRHVRALLREDLSWLDSVPLDVIVEPLFTRFADMPAYVVLDVLEGLRDLPGIRLQYEAMVEGWW
ncbi:MAG: hypothetical protein QNJ90_01375 [Planctomycetota bacterium]|nr:hypothetical protein [Planctomycetota bacterium]